MYANGGSGGLMIVLYTTIRTRKERKILRSLAVVKWNMWGEISELNMQRTSHKEWQQEEEEREAEWRGKISVAVDRSNPSKAEHRYLDSGASEHFPPH